MLTRCATSDAAQWNAKHPQQLAKSLAKAHLLQSPPPWRSPAHCQPCVFTVAVQKGCTRRPVGGRVPVALQHHGGCVSLGAFAAHDGVQGALVDNHRKRCVTVLRHAAAVAHIILRATCRCLHLFASCPATATGTMLSGSHDEGKH